MTPRFCFLTLILLTGTYCNAQLWKEPANAADVEKRVSIWSGISTLPVYPAPDSINRLHIKKTVQLIGMGYGDGSFSKGKAREEFDREGFVIRDSQKEGSFRAKRRWNTEYSYSDNHRHIRIVTGYPSLETQVDSLSVDEKGRLREKYNLVLNFHTEYFYSPADGALEKIITTDSTGRTNITSLGYNDAGLLVRMIELSTDSLKTDTIVLLNIIRDDKNRITHYDYFTKHSFVFQENDPASLKFTQMAEDYGYDERDRLILRIEDNMFYKTPWKTIYVYENERLSREERTIDSTVTIREHYWNGLEDSIVESTRYKNYFGSGPMTIKQGYEIIIYNTEGNYTEWTKYLLNFGITEPSSRMVVKYDEQNRLIHSESYEYDFTLKHVVQRSASDVRYYPNGLLKSDVYYGPNHQVTTASHWKYRFYRRKS